MKPTTMRITSVQSDIETELKRMVINYTPEIPGYKLCYFLIRKEMILMRIRNTIISFTTNVYLYVVRFVSDPLDPETDRLAEIVCDNYHSIDNFIIIADFEEEVAEKPIDFEKGYREILKVSSRDIDELIMWQNGERIYL